MNNDKDNATLYAELEAERFMTDQISLLHEAEDLADGINFMLKSLGEFTDADRAYVFETSENHTSTNTYEWCAAGVTPQIRNLHDIPFESMPKWIEVFLHGENILIEDLEAYRESMPLEYELLKVQNVSTLIAFPISVHEKLIGFVGVDNPDMEKSNLLHRLLSLLGKYVGTMIKDHKNEQMRLEVVASKSRLDYQGNGICIRGYHQDVTRNIENKRKYQNLTAATSQIYHAIYHIDLIQDRIEKLAGANQNYTPTGVVTSATAQLNDILEKMVAPSHHEIMQYFFDLTTVNDRLHGKLFISREYPSPQGIWRRATFIVQNRDTDDDVTEILYVTQIIDDYKQKELAYQQELVKAVESANQANTAKTDFLNRMSHDIRTPLNGILGMLDIAQKNETNPKALLECHEKMRTAAFHLKALVNDVLDMQRMETDRFFLEQIPFDIREILDNCWSMLEAQASRLDITLKKIKPGSLKYPYLIGSPLHIRQIFMNLLSNAIKYNKPGGSISIHAKIIRQVHQNVIYKFIISDTGIGISPEFQKHIFEPFAQEDTGARTIYKGTGLGMAIVHRLVQEMGGTIQLKSEKNVGSTFTLILPFTIDEHQPSASAETDTDTPADLTDLHILVVEDNELNLEIAVFSLEAAGLNVSTAINGLKAVRLFEKSKPYEYDIILMDIMMPVMNGLDAAKAIRGLSRPDATTVPIIALSANAFAEDIQKSKNAGINEHLAKPLEMDKVLKVIASYCK